MWNWQEVERAQRNLVLISKWLDAANAHHHPEAVTWGRLSKITEEAGEVIGAYIGYTGMNPRKGETHNRQQVIEELLDVAVTALGAVEHLSGHRGLAFWSLVGKINGVAKRAGVADTDEEG
jgi:NTP pyrophosphatase (non-canonical NTP hydrolase)